MGEYRSAIAKPKEQTACAIRSVSAASARGSAMIWSTKALRSKRTDVQPQESR